MVVFICMVEMAGGDEADEDEEEIG